MAKILVICEESQAITIALRKLGHEAFSNDIQACSGGHPEWHLQMDCFKAFGLKKWDMIIAHPPCTYLSVSGMHWTTRGLRDPKLTEDALKFVQILMDSPIPRICLENPVSVISSRIRQPDQIVNPYQFGEDASKKTCLWFKGLSLLRPTNFVDPRMVCCGAEVPNGDKYGCPNCNGDKAARPRWGNQCDSGQNKLGPSDGRWKERSRTYQGIAEAMADQWS